MFTLHLKYPSYFSQEAESLAQVIRDLGNDSSYKEEAGIEIVHSYFDIVNKTTCDRFNHLVGAAASLCKDFPVHEKECECGPCDLRTALRDLILESAEVENKKEKLAEGWKRGWGGPGYGFPVVNDRIKAVEVEAQVSGVERLAKEFSDARERDEL